MINNTLNKLLLLIRNRIFLLFMLFVMCFFLLLLRFYHLQITQKEESERSIRAATTRKLPVAASRGAVYDRFGRPLAINKTAFAVKMDLSISVYSLNAVLEDLVQVFETNHEDYLDELPITKTEPFQFTFSSIAAEKRWKKDMGLKEEQMNDTAVEILDYLRGYFGIPKNFSSEKARKLIAFRTEIFMQRYRKYQSITLARHISPQTMAVIEEQPERFPGVYIEAYAEREYPEGESVSHLLGYIGMINKEELAEFEPMGYADTDLIGKLGIEKAYESILRGKIGEEWIEVDPGGKRINSIQTTAPLQGGDLYLTIDSHLQKKTFQLLKENLKEVLLRKMDSGEISEDQVLKSLIKGNKLSIKEIMTSQDDSIQSDLKRLILSKLPHINPENIEEVSAAKEVILEAISAKRLQPEQLITCMAEQKTIPCDRTTLMQLQKRMLSPYSLIREKIASGEISPSDTNLDPCTGSAAVVDVSSGELLALVSYPSYDNNKLVNHFDNPYYQNLLTDPTTPLINRPLMERKAPGSVLKMLTAVAALESGIITRDTQIEDQGVYQKAGSPYAKCLIFSRYGSTHGVINVSKAIEVSCNYFFYEVAYRLGNEKSGTTLEAIRILNQYMRKFGLDSYSGIEIEELKPKMASPEVKKAIVEAVDKKAFMSQKKWMDGDSIRCAIGQSYNSFSVIHIAKYIAALANGQVRYKMNLVKGIRRKEGTNIELLSPVIEEQLRLSPDTLEAVYQGMLGVTIGSQGTLRHFFNDFPIKVAAKTGTAEEAKNRPSHTWFVSFAPYDHPQIAVVVMIPFGESKFGPATEVAKGIMAEYFGLYNECDKAFVNHNDFIN